MATDLKQSRQAADPRHPIQEPIFIDAVDMANIEQAVAEGAGDVDQYLSTGSDDLDEANIRDMIAEALVAAKVDAAKLYAFLTIGCLVTVENISRLTTTQVTAWKSAVQDYRRRHCGHA